MIRSETRICNTQQLDSLDLLEHARVLRDAHAEQFLRTPVLVQNIARVLSQLFHVGANQHLSQFDEITVVLVVDLDDTPWIDSSPNFTTIRSPDYFVRSDDGEGDFARDFLSLCKRFFVLVVVCGRLEDVNVVERDIGKYL